MRPTTIVCYLFMDPRSIGGFSSLGSMIKESLIAPATDEYDVLLDMRTVGLVVCEGRQLFGNEGCRFNFKWSYVFAKNELSGL